MAVTSEQRLRALLQLARPNWRCKDLVYSRNRQLRHGWRKGFESYAPMQVKMAWVTQEVRMVTPQTLNPKP